MIVSMSNSGQKTLISLRFVKYSVSVQWCIVFHQRMNLVNWLMMAIGANFILSAHVIYW
jgi:acyl-CoA thioesterase